MSTSANQYYEQANDAFIEEDIDEALDLYGKAIALDDQKPDYFIKRSTAFEKIKKYPEALKDAQNAVALLKEKEDQRELGAKAHLRQGIAQYQLKEYSAAKASFDQSLSLNPNDKSLKSWITKVETELSKVAISGGSPSSARVRHEWFQSEEYVSISIFIKNVKKDTVEISFSDRAVSVTIKMPTGSDYSLELDPLAHEILPAESSYSILASKIDIKMKKAKIGQKWGALEGEDTLPGTISSGQNEPVQYPSSSKHGPRNWDKLEKEAEKDEDKPDGERALNALFQQIYRDADEDTRRAMVKSFTESNGTTLSTNWKEVGVGKVETKPPEGMIAKKYTE